MPPAAAADADRAPVVIDQKDFTFVPRVVGVRSLAPVRFTNSDPANHNVRSAALERENQFNVFTSAGNDYLHRFVSNRAGRPVRLGCDIHGWMQAWIYVFDHPWYQVTDHGGKFALPVLPTGTYQLEVRQPDVGLRTTREVEVKAGETTRVVIEFTQKDLSSERR
jgi:plastocyanin